MTPRRPRWDPKRSSSATGRRRRPDSARAAGYRYRRRRHRARPRSGTATWTPPPGEQPWPRYYEPFLGSLQRSDDALHTSLALATAALVVSGPPGSKQSGCSGRDLSLGADRDVRRTWPSDRHRPERTERLPGAKLLLGVRPKRADDMEPGQRAERPRDMRRIAGIAMIALATTGCIGSGSSASSGTNSVQSTTPTSEPRTD